MNSDFGNIRIIHAFIPSIQNLSTFCQIKMRYADITGASGALFVNWVLTCLFVESAVAHLLTNF